MSCMVFIDLYWSMQSRGLFYPLHIKLTIHGNITTLIKKTHQVFLCNTCKQYMTSLQILMKNSALLQHFLKKGGGVPKNLDTQKSKEGAQRRIQLLFQTSTPCIGLSFCQNVHICVKRLLFHSVQSQKIAVTISLSLPPPLPEL